VGDFYINSALFSSSISLKVVLGRDEDIRLLSRKVRVSLSEKADQREENDAKKQFDMMLKLQALDWV